MNRYEIARLLALAEYATDLAGDAVADQDHAWLAELRARWDHRHTPFIMRVSPGGYRWVCATCPVVGGPPRETAAEAWRMAPGGAYDAEVAGLAA